MFIIILVILQSFAPSLPFNQRDVGVRNYINLKLGFSIVIANDNILLTGSFYFCYYFFVIHTYTCQVITQSTVHVSHPSKCCDLLAIATDSCRSRQPDCYYRLLPISVITSILSLTIQY